MDGTIRWRGWYKERRVVGGVELCTSAVLSVQVDDTIPSRVFPGTELLQ